MTGYWHFPSGDRNFAHFYCYFMLFILFISLPLAIHNAGFLPTVNAFSPITKSRIGKRIYKAKTVFWHFDYAMSASYMDKKYSDFFIGRRSALFLAESNLSASEREKRNEEKRRKERKNDVVVGKTSAVPDANDFKIDVKATEDQWLQQASGIERKIFQLTEKGMESLKMLQLEESNSIFDEIYKLRPDAYLWQAGIAKFYLGDYESAANIFSKNAKLFESKFGGRAGEERIWTDACILKSYYSTLSRKEQKAIKDQNNGKLYPHKSSPTFLQPVSEYVTSEDDEDDLFNALFATETRKDIKIAGDLFRSSIDDDIVGVILSRAKLRSISGSREQQPKKNFATSLPDHKLWKINSFYYLGLHFDCIEQYDESRECMKMALELCPSTGKSDNIIHTLPFLHMAQRDWFDDDPMIESDYNDAEGNNIDTVASTATNITTATPSFEQCVKEMEITAKLKQKDLLFFESIKESVAILRHKDLQNVLRLRCLSSDGSKVQMQMRLLQSFLKEMHF